MKGHYEDSGIDKKTMHAMKARKLASDVSLRKREMQILYVPHWSLGSRYS